MVWTENVASCEMATMAYLFLRSLSCLIGTVPRVGQRATKEGSDSNCLVDCLGDVFKGVECENGGKGERKSDRFWGEDRVKRVLSAKWTGLWKEAKGSNETRREERMGKKRPV